jgi:hypothetical protein
MVLSSVAMLACGVAAWFMLKWYFQTHIDEQLLYVTQNKVTLFLVVLSYVFMFYYFILLTVLALIAIGVLVKVLVLDFFSVEVNPEIFRSMLLFVTSKDHLVFNGIVAGAFAMFSLVSILLKDGAQTDPASVRAMLNNQLLLLLTFYTVGGFLFLIKHAVTH